MKCAAAALMLLATVGSVRADTFEPNDSLETAYGPLQTHVSYNSYLTAADPGDWFYMDVEPGNISIQLRSLPPGTDYDLLLWDENGILAASQADSSINESIEAFSTQSQRLWIQVESVQGFSQSDPYELTAMFPMPVPNEPPLLAIGHPLGGEVWYTRVSESITWTADDTEDNEDLAIDLEYSIDGGETWATIALGLSNSGQYQWTIPDSASEQARVRARAIDSQPDTTTALSDIFSIRRTNLPPTVTLLSPNGGEVLTVGDSLMVIAAYDDPESPQSLNAQIHLSLDGGQTWTLLFASTANASLGVQLPGVPSPTALLRVQVTDPQGASSSDTSDAVFSLVPPAPETPAVRMGSTSATYLSQIVIPLFLEDASPSSLAVELNLPNHPPGLLLENLEAAPRCAGCTVQHQKTETGLSIVVSSSQPGGIPQSKEPLLELTFQVWAAPEETLPLRVHTVTAVDAWARTLSAVTIDGAVQVTGQLPQVSLALAPVSTAVAETVRVPIQIDSSAPLDSLALTLRTDAATLVWQGLERGPAAGDWRISADAVGDSLFLRFGGDTAPAPSDTLCSLLFIAQKGSEANLEWADAQAWGPGAVSLPLTTIGTTVTPVSIVAFDVVGTPDGALLSWDLLGEMEAIDVLVQRSGNEGMTSVSLWISASARIFLDSTAKPGQDYDYQLTFRMRSGELIYSHRESVSLPDVFSVGAPYPNPSRESVFSAYRGEIAAAKIYDIQGRLIQSLDVPAPGGGTLVWDGRSLDGTPVVAGLYFLRVHGPRGYAVHRVVRTR